jgi:hypothetical protein
LGNWDEQNSFEHFDVYIRGVGPFQERDNEGRFFFYRKCDSMKVFLSEFDRKMLKVYDGLCMLISAYGNAIELEKAQEGFFAAYSYSYPPRNKESADFPTNVPERESKKKELHALENGTIMHCRNWGCGKQYLYDDNPTNTGNLCRFHPGKYEFGSINVNNKKFILIDFIFNWKFFYNIHRDYGLSHGPVAEAIGLSSDAEEANTEESMPKGFTVFALTMVILFIFPIYYYIYLFF